MADYKKGDTLTIVPRLIGSQSSRVRGVLTDENDKHWMIRPEGVTYSYNFTHEDWVIEEIEEVALGLPTDPGAIITWRDGAYLPQIAQLDGGPRDLGWRTDCGDTPRWVSERQLAALIGEAHWTRLRPESEMSEVDLDFYTAIGTDPEKLRAAAITLAKAGLSGEEDIEAMVSSWMANRARWARIAHEATRYAEGS